MAGLLLLVVCMCTELSKERMPQLAAHSETSCLAQCNIDTWLFRSCPCISLCLSIGTVQDQACYCCVYCIASPWLTDHSAVADAASDGDTNAASDIT